MNTTLCIKKNNNNSLSSKDQNMNFGAGLTPKMMQEIQQSDVLEISNRLAKKRIPTDFQNNKVVAWCCDKTIAIIQQFNDSFNTKLCLPNGIYLEDFRNLKDNPNAVGTCNLLPFPLRKNSDEKVPEKTIFFNSMINWDDVDRISDVNFAEKMFSSDFFLYPFLHEFSHAMHVDRLIKKFRGEKLVNEIELARENRPIQALSESSQDAIASICNYALKNPLETIACDLPMKIIDSVDRETFKVQKNPLDGSPYEKLEIWKWLKVSNYTDEELHLKEVLRNFWNGKFD